MRRAFSLLEALCALMIFSILILSCSKILLQVYKDTKTYKEASFENQILDRSLLLLSQYLKYCIAYQNQNGVIEFFTPIFEEFLSSNFKIMPKECQTQILHYNDPAPLFFASLSSRIEILQVFSQKGNLLFLDQKIPCAPLLALQKNKIWLNHKKELMLNDQVLAQGVLEFQIKEEDSFFVFRICLKRCKTYKIYKGGVFEII